MAFDIEKLLKGFLGDSESSTKKNNNTNAKKRIDDGGKAKLRASQAKSNAKKMKDSKGQGRSTKAGDLIGLTRVRTGPKRSTLRLTENSDKVFPSKDNLKDRQKALSDKRKKALAIIKKDTSNTKTDSTSKSKKDTSKKKVIVTKAQLEKSGLSLRDYMNMLKSKETGRTITRDSRFDKKKKSPSTSSMKNTFSDDVGKSTKVKKKPSKMNPNKANEFASLKKMTNTVKKNKDGKMVIKKNKQGKYVIKKGY